MNFIQRIYLRIKYHFVKSKVFIQGYALIKHIDNMSFDYILKDYFYNNHDNLDGYTPSSNCFFKEGYLTEYEDVAESEIEPWHHYVLLGKAEGRDNGLNPPKDIFFKEGYLTEYEDVAASEIEPWHHYVLSGKAEGRDNGLNPPKDIFFKEGYLAEYEDVAISEIDPWEHYAISGKDEGRDNGLKPNEELYNSYKFFLMYTPNIFDQNITWTKYVLTYFPKYKYDLDILCIKNSPFFNEKWYKNINSDIDFKDYPPAYHYLYKGWMEGRNPSLSFSNEKYLEYYPDIKLSNVCPLLHFEKSGRVEGRTNKPLVDKKKVEVSKKLKNINSILLISHELTYTGAPLSLLFASKVLVDNGYSVAVVSFEYGNLSEEFESNGIPVYVTQDKNCVEIFASLSDVVIANTLVSYEFYELCSMIVPTIWWVSEAPKYFDYLPYFSEIFKKARNIYVMSDYSKEQFIPYNADIKVIKHGIIDKYDTNKDNLTNNDKIQFSFLGTYNSRKGIDILIKAINLLPVEIIKNCLFFFAGNKHADEKYVDYINNLLKDDYKESVCFHEIITDTNELEQVYYKSSCFIVPSRMEPTSLVVIEAMMHGRPCIISNNVGAKYLINEKTGLIFENENFEQLKNCIINIYDTITSSGNSYFNECRNAYISNNSVEVFTKNLIYSIESIRS